MLLICMIRQLRMDIEGVYLDHAMNPTLLSLYRGLSTYLPWQCPRLQIEQRACLKKVQHKLEHNNVFILCHGKLHFMISRHRKPFWLHMPRLVQRGDRCMTRVRHWKCPNDTLRREMCRMKPFCEQTFSRMCVILSLCCIVTERSNIVKFIKCESASNVKISWTIINVWFDKPGNNKH